MIVFFVCFFFELIFLFPRKKETYFLTKKQKTKTQKGPDWYKGGRLLRKQATFDDFAAVARHLVSKRFARPNAMVIGGRSAGGLLMGVMANRAASNHESVPDFAGIILQVPFVDVVGTMIDPEMPWTEFEYDEWGDPNNEDHLRNMASYSPYENIVAKGKYPPMLVLGGWHDSRVSFSEPAKFVAAIRHLAEKSDTVLLHTFMAGHLDDANSDSALDLTALEYAFILDAVASRCAGKLLFIIILFWFWF